MRKARIVMVLLLGTVLVSGLSCSDGSLDILDCVPSLCLVCGTYVSQADSSHSMQILDDSTAYLREGGVTKTAGTWYVSGTHVTINWQGYPPTSAEFTGNTILEDNGTRWVKQ